MVIMTSVMMMMMEIFDLRHSPLVIMTSVPMGFVVVDHHPGPPPRPHHHHDDQNHHGHQNVENLNNKRL